MPLLVQVNGRKGAFMSVKTKKVSNRAGYDLWASFYDQYPNSTVAADENSFPQVWAQLKGKRVLEIGCGTGRHTQKLVAQGNEVVGIDLSAEMLQVARKKLERESVTFIEADFMMYEGFASGYFDAAIASLVIEHIEDVDGFLKRVASVLKPSGELFVSEIHPFRSSKGTLAHFQDPESSTEIHLTSYSHSEKVIEKASVTSGMDIALRIDVLGTEALSRARPGWDKYLGMPMIKIWSFKKKSLF